MANIKDDRHPGTDTLLDYLDNCCSDEDSSHIKQCLVCLNEVVQIRESRARLQQLPQVQAPAHIWNNIRKEIATDQPGSIQKRPVQYKWFAVAASVVLAISLLILSPTQNPVQPAVKEDDTRYLALLQQSQQLEATLSYLDRQPTIINLSTVGRISQYRDSISTIDLALGEQSQRINKDFRNSLMQERVNLLQKLVREKAQPLVSKYKTF